MNAVVKLACTVATVGFPLFAGHLVHFAASDKMQITIVVTGVAFGLAALFGFRAVERGEEAQHNRRLQGHVGGWSAEG